MSFYNFLPFLSSVAPSIAILLIFYFQDRYPEPPKIIVITFILGIIISIPAAAINDYSYSYITTKYLDDSISFAQQEFYHALIPGAVVEEILKFLILYFYCFRLTYLDEKIDALVYGITISLGFAAIENVQYVFNASDYELTWSVMAWVRAFSAVPAHASWGLIMGYFLYTYKDRKFKAILLSLSVPILLHMLYNSSYISFTWILIISLILSISFFSKSKKLQYLSPWK